jgi:hypothetical protein
MTVKFAYDAPWKGGRIHIEADSKPELEKTIEELRKDDGFHTDTSVPLENGQTNTLIGYPPLSGNVGCSGAIRTLLAHEWGIEEPRTEAELTQAMKANAIHYSHGTISSVLTFLTRRGELRRVGKKHGSYAYTLNRSSGLNPE